MIEKNKEIDMNVKKIVNVHAQEILKLDFEQCEYYEIKNIENKTYLIQSDISIKTVTFSNLNNVKIIVDKLINYSVVISNAKNCIFVIDCQQLRIRNCSQCNFHVNIRNDNYIGAIVLESSFDCYFGPKLLIYYLNDSNDSSNYNSIFYCNIDLMKIQKQLTNVIFNDFDKTNYFNLEMVKDFDCVNSSNFSYIYNSPVFTIAIFITNNKFIKFISLLC